MPPTDPFSLALAAAYRLAIDADRDAALAQLAPTSEFSPGAIAYLAAMRSRVVELSSGEV